MYLNDFVINSFFAFNVSFLKVNQYSNIVMSVYFFLIYLRGKKKLSVRYKRIYIFQIFGIS